MTQLKNNRYWNTNYEYANAGHWIGFLEDFIKLLAPYLIYLNATRLIYKIAINFFYFCSINLGFIK